MVWTEERIRLLREMWTDGRSSTEIAKAIGVVTRNAVMGKINRLGLIASVDHNSRMTRILNGCCKPKEDVIVITTGAIARAWAAQTTPDPLGWRLPYALVEHMTGHSYDPAKQGHRSSLVGLSTIVSRGDPRKVLMPKMAEPAVLGIMRILAAKGLVVGGKTPERWRDEENGDAAFFEDMLTVENVSDHKPIVSRPARRMVVA